MDKYVSALKQDPVLTYLFSYIQQIVNEHKSFSVLYFPSGNIRLTFAQKTADRLIAVIHQRTLCIATQFFTDSEIDVYIKPQIAQYKYINGINTYNIK